MLSMPYVKSQTKDRVIERGHRRERPVDRSRAQTGWPCKLAFARGEHRRARLPAAPCWCPAQMEQKVDGALGRQCIPLQRRRAEKAPEVAQVAAIGEHGVGRAAAGS